MHQVKHHKNLVHRPRIAIFRGQLSRADHSPPGYVLLLYPVFILFEHNELVDLDLAVLTGVSLHEHIIEETQLFRVKDFCSAEAKRPEFIICCCVETIKDLRKVLCTSPYSRPQGQHDYFSRLISNKDF